MKLYDFKLAPNARRVRIFLVEKALDIPLVEVNTREMEQFGEAFQAVSKHGVVPVLEFDDGSRIGESVAICRYFEAIQPEPPLMGTDAKDQAIVEMWNRRAEIEGYLPIADAARNSLPRFAGRAVPGVRGGVEQIPALVERGRASALRFFDKLDGQLADSDFIAGARYSIADITAFVAIEFGQGIEINIPDACGHVRRWYETMAARPSASA